MMKSLAAVESRPPRGGGGLSCQKDSNLPPPHTHTSVCFTGNFFQKKALKVLVSEVGQQNTPAKGERTAPDVPHPRL